MNYKNSLVVITMALFGVLVPVSAQIATGGTYTLDQGVIANGGGRSIGGVYTGSGTTGQSAAGVNAAGGTYAVRTGFWPGAALPPTAAHVAVSGRVLNPEGAGIRNAIVILEGDGLTAPRTVVTSSFGYFTFDDVEVGQMYIISVSSKRYGFGQSSQALSVVDTVSNIVFQASWLN